MVARVDPFQLHADEYAAIRTPRILAVAPTRFLSLPGGDAGTPPFEERAAFLLEVAREVKAAVRRDRDKDFKLPPLEALWWSEGAGGWSWKLLLRVPTFVRPADVAAAADGEVRLETLAEGRCVQALHVGPRAGEPATLARMRAAAAEQGLVLHGRLHAVYLSDVRRAALARRRTVLRHPVRAR
jgi:hypothetical protein